MSDGRTPTRVLIVDDEPASCGALQEFLERQGCKVMSAQSPEEGLARATALADANEPFDIVLLDQVFPDPRVKGVDWVPAFREALPGCHVVIMTAYLTTSEEKRTAFERGVDGYLVKPLDLETTGKFLAAIPAIQNVIQEFETAHKWMKWLPGNGQSVAVCVVDRVCTLRYMNSSFRSRLGEKTETPCVCWMDLPCKSVWQTERGKCPVEEAFETRKPCEMLVPCEQGGEFSLALLKVLPYSDPETGEVIAAVKAVYDYSEEMLSEMRAAVLKGRDEFVATVEKRLEDVDRLLGFDRSRLYVSSSDPDIIQCLAGAGYYGIDVRKAKLDLKKDESSKHTIETADVCFYRGTEYEHDEIYKFLRPNETPWLEAPLFTGDPTGPRRFIGKVVVDNDPTERTLKDTDTCRQTLKAFAQTLAPVVAAARDHWVFESKAARLARLQEFDREFLQAESLEDQAKQIVKYIDLLVKPDNCHIRFREGRKLRLLASMEGRAGVIPEIVNIDEDRETSLSTAQANAPNAAIARIWTSNELRGLADRLSDQGKQKSAEYFRDLESCGAFGLVDSGGGLIGTLILDSRSEFFFDRETVSLVEQFASRAQLLLEGHKVRQELKEHAERIKRVLDSIPAEVVVVDRRAAIRLFNRAFGDRVRSAYPDAMGAARFAGATRCLGASRDLLENAVKRVFEQGRSEYLRGVFAGAGGKSIRMEVTVTAFERTDQSIETVAIQLTDVEAASVIQSLSLGGSASGGVSEALKSPLEAVAHLFKADTAAVLEILSLTGEQEYVRRHCIWPEQSIPRSSEPAEVTIYPTNPEFEAALRKDGFSAVADMETDPRAPEGLRKRLRETKIRSILFVPVYVRGEVWGRLALGSKESREWDGRTVMLAQAAGMQISQIVSSWQRARLQKMDGEMAKMLERLGTTRNELEQRQREFLDYLIGQAADLCACQGGHARIVDWSLEKPQAILTAAADPFIKEGRPPYRKQARVGESVSGKVALEGKPRICNDSRQDEASCRILEEVPPEWTDLRDYLQKQRSCVCYPLVSDNLVLGTFSLSGLAPNQFAGGRLSLLEEIITRATLQLTAFLRIQQMEDVAEELNHTLQVPDLQALWQHIPALLVRLFRCEDAMVSSYDARRNVLRREARYFKFPPEAGVVDVGKEAAPSDEPRCGFTLYVAKTGQFLRLKGDDIGAHPHFFRQGPLINQRLPSKGCHSIMVCRMDAPDGRILGVVKVQNRKGRLERRGFTDFDELLMRQVATQLAVAVDRLGLLESRQRGLAERTHDLKQPLQAISAVLRNFREGVYSLPDNKDGLELAWQQSKLLDAFVTSTIDVAVGRIPPDRVKPLTFNIKEVIGESLDVFMPVFKQEDWTRIIQVDLSAQSLFGDPRQILRVLVNLLDNAIKHSYPSEGAEEDLAREITIEAHVEGNRWAVVRVADRGVGFARTLQEIVPMAKPEPLSQEEVERHGIGLMGVRLIAQAHEGDVRFLSREDRKPGAVVEVRWDQAALRAKYAPTEEH